MAKYPHSLDDNIKEGICEKCGEIVYFHKVGGHWLPPKCWVKQLLIDDEGNETEIGDWYDHVCGYDYNTTKKYKLDPRIIL